MNEMDKKKGKKLPADERLEGSQEKERKEMRPWMLLMLHNEYGGQQAEFFECYGDLKGFLERCLPYFDMQYEIYFRAMSGIDGRYSYHIVQDPAVSWKNGDT